MTADKITTHKGSNTTINMTIKDVEEDQFMVKQKLL